MRFGWGVTRTFSSVKVKYPKVDKVNQLIEDKFLYNARYRKLKSKVKMRVQSYRMWSLDTWIHNWVRCEKRNDGTCHFRRSSPNFFCCVCVKITLSFLERHNNSIVIAAHHSKVNNNKKMLNAQEYAWSYLVRWWLFLVCACVCVCLLFVNRNTNKPICFNADVGYEKCVRCTIIIQFRLSRRIHWTLQCFVIRAIEKTATQYPNILEIAEIINWGKNEKREDFTFFSVIKCNSLSHILFTRL